MAIDLEIFQESMLFHKLGVFSHPGRVDSILGRFV